MSRYMAVKYGTTIVDYNNKMCIAWREMMRKLFKLAYRAHSYIVCGIVECISIKLERRLAKCILHFK